MYYGTQWSGSFKYLGAVLGDFSPFAEICLFLEFTVKVIKIFHFLAPSVSAGPVFVIKVVFMLIYPILHSQKQRFLPCEDIPPYIH